MMSHLKFNDKDAVNAVMKCNRWKLIHNGPIYKVIDAHRMTVMFLCDDSVLTWFLSINDIHQTLVSKCIAVHAGGCRHSNPYLGLSNCEIIVKCDLTVNED